PDAHRTEANLHVSEDFALEPVHRDYRDRKADKDQQDVDQRPEHISGGAGGYLDVRIEIGLDVLDELAHQRSTSPRTMSRVPMTAITSATSWPRHIKSRACRFTNDGGRTRTRYGCVEPSLTMKYPSSPFGASIEW